MATLNKCSESPPQKKDMEVVKKLVREGGKGSSQTIIKQTCIQVSMGSILRVSIAVRYRTQNSETHTERQHWLHL